MFVSLQNSYVEALTASVTVDRDGVFVGVIKVKWSHNHKALIRRGRDTIVFSPSYETHEMSVVSKPER